MASSSNGAEYGRIPKLNKPSEFIPWKRRIFAMILDIDPLLICFEDKPEDNASAAAKRAWASANAKAKARIILGLGDSAQTKTAAIVDDLNATAKQL